MKRMLSKLANGSRAFMRGEDGAALTEYIVLLGIITAAVITAVALFGTNLAAAWNAWAVWIGANLNTPS